jgi:hypothetical protein
MAQFNSKQEVIDHFVKQGKSAAAGASAWERGWRGHTPKKKELKPPPRSYHDDLDDKRYGETNEDCWTNYKQYGMKKKGKKMVPDCRGPVKENIEELEQLLAEAALGVEKKRASRPGSRPARGHESQPRYKKVGYCDACDRPADECVCGKEELDEHKKGFRAHKYTKKPKGPIGHLDAKKAKDVPGHKVVGPKKIKELDETTMKQPKQTFMIEGYTEEDLIGPVPVCEFCGCHDHTSLDESGKAKRSLCLSSKADSELGASQLSSCKAQGLRARAGGKSHKIGKSRVKVGGHKIKGKKYGGPLPDWS